MLHGLSSGIINYFRSGSFRAGFFSGIGSAFDIGTKGYGKMVGRTSIMAIIGGTFAKLGGGKFANGAMSAAFTHLFNGEFLSKIPTLLKINKMRKTTSTVYTGLMKMKIGVELNKIRIQTLENYNRWMSNKTPNNYPKYFEALQLGERIQTYMDFRIQYFGTTGVILSDSEIDRMFNK